LGRNQKGLGYECPEETLARAYVHHEQMVNAIFHCDRGNEFAKGSGALHSGVRKSCVPYYNNEDEENAGGVAPSGVEIIASDEEVDMSGLRYPRQDISGFNPADYLEMAEFEALLMENMDVDCDLFEKYSTTIATL
jgi:hypothetical protein